MESVGDEGEIQIKDFDVKSVPNQLAGLMQGLHGSRGWGGWKSRDSAEW